LFRKCTIQKLTTLKQNNTAKKHHNKYNTKEHSDVCNRYNFLEYLVLIKTDALQQKNAAIHTHTHSKKKQKNGYFPKVNDTANARSSRSA